MKLGRCSRVFLGTMALVLITLGVSGCLEGEARVAMRYDPATDCFHFLTIHHHLRGGTSRAGGGDAAFDFESDFKRLQTLWLNRDHLIMLEPLRILGGPPTFLRTGDRRFANVTLQDATCSDKTSREAPLDLSLIKIRPGTLFLESDDVLAYHHEVVVPGKFIDAMLVWARDELARDEKAVRTIDEELDRRKAGGPRLTWELLGRTLQSELEGTPAPATQPGEAPNDNLLACLDADSLLALRTAIARARIDLGRRGSVFYTRLPFTERDSKQLAALVDKLRPMALNKLSEKIAGDSTIDEVARPRVVAALQQLARTFTVTPRDNGVEVALDVASAGNLLWHMTATQPQRTPEEQKLRDERARQMALRVADRLPVEKNLKTEKIYEAFQSGTLKPAPSKQPVKPGEGMGLE